MKIKYSTKKGNPDEYLEGDIVIVQYSGNVVINQNHRLKEGDRIMKITTYNKLPSEMKEKHMYAKHSYQKYLIFDSWLIFHMNKKCIKRLATPEEIKKYYEDKVQF